jgi:hypothetical protein
MAVEGWLPNAQKKRNLRIGLSFFLRRFRWDSNGAEYDVPRTANRLKHFQS